MLGQSAKVVADTANGPSLIISQLKITSNNGQFVTLYNTTDLVVDMSRYQLEYFNNYDLSKATSSRLIALSGIVPPHGYFMINDSSLLLCYQLTVDSVSLGFSSTAGMVEVLALNQVNPGTGAVPQLQDYVGWAKTAAVGAQTLPANTNAFLSRNPIDSRNNPLISSAGSGSWQSVQSDVANPCKLITVSTTPTAVQSGLSQLLPASEPPVTIVNIAAEASDSAAAASFSLPASDIGLMAPQITELLPNPEGTRNDSTDEYIELYNPNPVSFDLTGFALQSGLKTLHKYNFTAGTILPAKSFKAFYSEETSLSMSNTSGQIKLLDPFGNSISATEIYAAAKGGQAWALANGKWFWTSTATPNLANVIKQTTLAKKARKSTSSNSKSRTASGVKATTAKISKNNSLSGKPGKTSASPVHLWTLAVIGGLAVVYGIYEYRNELGNRIFQLRQHLKDRRLSRSES